MWYKVAVNAPDGRHVERVVDAQEDGEIEAEIHEALRDYRRLYPDAPPFGFALKVSPA